MHFDSRCLAFKLEATCRLDMKPRNNHMQSESIFWVWLPVSAVLFCFVLVTTTHDLRVGLSEVECPESGAE